MNKPSMILLLLVAALAVTGCGGSESIEDALAAGQEAYDGRDYAGARRHFLQGLEIDSKNRDLLLWCARAYRQDYLLDSALYYLKRADLMQREDREINQEIREVAIQLGDWQNAIDAIEVLARTGDGHEMHAVELAELWERNNQPGRSFYWARRALTTRPDNPAIYLQTATKAAKYDSLDVAIEILDTAIARFGPMDQFVVNKAMLLAYGGRTARAESILRPLIEQAETPDPTMKLNLANVLAAQSDPAKKREAIELYEEIRVPLGHLYPIDSLMKAVRDELK